MSEVNLERALAIAQESDSMSGTTIEALVAEIKELRKENEMTTEEVEYTTYYFIDTRNGRRQEVNGVHNVEFERHFVLFYAENGVLVLGERQEHVTELRQDVAA